MAKRHGPELPKKSPPGSWGKWQRILAPLPENDPDWFEIDDVEFTSPDDVRNTQGYLKSRFPDFEFATRGSVLFARRRPTEEGE